MWVLEDSKLVDCLSAFFSWGGQEPSILPQPVFQSFDFVSQILIILFQLSQLIVHGFFGLFLLLFHQLIAVFELSELSDLRVRFEQHVVAHLGLRKQTLVSLRIIELVLSYLRLLDLLYPGAVFSVHKLEITDFGL